MKLYRPNIDPIPEITVKEYNRLHIPDVGDFSFEYYVPNDSFIEVVFPRNNGRIIMLIGYLDKWKVKYQLIDNGCTVLIPYNIINDLNNAYQAI